MIRPLYRWKSFWLGLFVLVFFGWAWERSQRLADQASLSFPSTQVAFAVEQCGGIVTFQWLQWNAYLPAGLFKVQGTVTMPASWTFPNALDFPGLYGARFSVMASHWFLMVLFSLVWGGLLMWRMSGLKKFTAVQNPKKAP